MPQSAHLNAFTIDVEDWFQVAALAPVIDRSTWSTQEYRVERNMERLLALLAEHGVHGTFFVLGWVAERSPQLVRTIAAAGHEIASHGYSHQLIYEQTPEVFRQETLRSKAFLEDCIGAPVLGYRAASFSITAKSLWALDTLIDAGFEYDSSIFPIRHDRYGIPGAGPHPMRIAAPSGRTIAEFPMSTASFMGKRIPVSGGGYFRLLPYWFIRAGLKQINEKQNVPFTFYLHPWEIDPEQPRVRASLTSRLRHYTNLGGCYKKLKRLLMDFRFAKMSVILEQHVPICDS